MTIPWGLILQGAANIADTWLEYTDEDSRYYKDKGIALQRMLDPLNSMPTWIMGAAGRPTNYTEGDEYIIDDLSPLLGMAGSMIQGGTSGGGSGSGGGGAAGVDWGNMITGMLTSGGGGGSFGSMMGGAGGGTGHWSEYIPMAYSMMGSMLKGAGSDRSGGGGGEGYTGPGVGTSYLPQPRVSPLLDPYWNRRKSEEILVDALVKAMGRARRRMI